MILLVWFYFGVVGFFVFILLFFIGPFFPSLEIQLPDQLGTILFQTQALHIELYSIQFSVICFKQWHTGLETPDTKPAEQVILS